MIRVVLSVALLALTGVNSLSAQEPGETVIIVREVTTPALSGGTAVIAKGEMLSVEEVQPDRLRVSSPELPNRPPFEGWIARKDLLLLTDALEFFNAEIKTQPTAYAYSVRGLIWTSKDEFDKAIVDYSAAIQLEPRVPAFFHDRGFAWEKKKDYAKALADYEQAISLDPQNPETRNDAAWVWATCPVDSLRHPRKAFDHASKACETVEYKEWNYLDTLAAACAALGNFADAVKWQKRALEIAPGDVKGEVSARLKLYESGKPYRETP